MQKLGTWKLSLKKSSIFAVFIIAFTNFSIPATAYVLKGPHILDLMTRKLGSRKTLLVSQTLMIYDTGSPKKAVEFSETVRYFFPETFRSDIMSENAHRIHVLSKGEALTVIDGRVSANPETRFDLYKDLLLYHSRILLQKRLSLFGVDLSIASLGRFQGRIAFVLGSQYPDESRPQVWIEKDTFIPFRWVLTSKNAQHLEDSLEVRYLEWQRVDNTWYPMRIEFYQNGALAREIRVDMIQVNPLFSEKLFDISYLNSVYQPAATIAPDQMKPEGLDEIQKTIEEFKRAYE